MAIEDKLRGSVSEHVSLLEMILYLCVGALLCVAAIGGIYHSGVVLWQGIADGRGLLALDQLLLVLMIIEILHTVRISIRTQHLTVVPFLIVGLIATIRRVLVIGMQAARVTEGNSTSHGDPAVAFRNSMIELGILGALILIFVFSIYFLRTTSAVEESG